MENSNEHEKRDCIIDIVKALGIILMVIGHSGSPFAKWIYLFHMSLFFIVSGYCLKDNYSNSLDTIISFCRKRVCSLYVPCVLFNSTVILLHNRFVHFYLVDDIQYDIKLICIKLLKAILFSGGEQLSGATWFLRTMFASQLLYVIIEAFCKKISKRYEALKCFIFLCSLLISWKIPVEIDGYKYFNVLTAIPLLHVGHTLRKYDIKIRTCYIIPCVIFLGIAPKLGVEIDFAVNLIGNPFVFLACAISGYVACYVMACWIAEFPVMKKISEYIGKSTLPIMLFHFIALKIVTFFEIKLEKGSLKKWPVIQYMMQVV